MTKIMKLKSVLCVWLVILSSANVQAKTPVEKHGVLQVVNGQVVNQKNQPVSLAGPSLFWSNDGWEGEQYYNSKVIETFATQWQAGIVRAAIGVDNKGGYIVNPQGNYRKAERVIEAAIEQGLYVIVDWHSHHAEDHLLQALDFFQKIAKKYGHYPNIIYEIYNEPLKNTDWSAVIKPYAESVIKEIRNIDKQNIILVGTQSWSQDVDKVVDDPITNASNIAYTLHFYAGTHKQALRQKANKALQAGLALIVSEWGTVNADGDGNIDEESTRAWLDFLRQHQLIHCAWSVTNKREGSALLTPNAASNGQWQSADLSKNGHFLKDIIQQWGY